MRVLFFALIAATLIGQSPEKSHSRGIRILEPGMYWSSDFTGGTKGEWVIVSVENGQGWLTLGKLSQGSTTYGDKTISTIERVKGQPWIYIQNLPSIPNSPTWAFSAIREVEWKPLITPKKRTLSTNHPIIGDIKLIFDPPTPQFTFNNDMICTIHFGQSTQRIVIDRGCNDSSIHGVAVLDIDGDGKLDLIVSHVGYPGRHHLCLFLSSSASPGKLLGRAIRLSHGGE
ncbi:FG-GAP repeat protein [Geothrix fermentans]|uniref:FG-GAP repeat protein n=1 Tax=Geothrix fermentans TaxID=44676 RepID=UPI0012F9BE78|nr:FG-GAP repeat protein [Geothrix fermentans]